MVTTLADFATLLYITPAYHQSSGKSKAILALRFTGAYIPATQKGIPGSGSGATVADDRPPPIPVRRHLRLIRRGRCRGESGWRTYGQGAHAWFGLN